MKLFYTLVAVVGIGAAGGAAWWWQHRAASPAAAEQRSVAKTGASAASAARDSAGPVSVEVAPVERMRLEDDVQAVGTLRSRQSVTLRPEVSGRIAKIGFADGQRVRRGQLLVQLDDSLQAAQLQQAEAQAQIARTNLQRSRELLAQNFVSRSATDQAGAALEVAEAQVALAKAQRDRMRIVAPFDGVAGIKAVHVGDYVKDGADLVALEDLSSMQVDFRLPEHTLAKLRVGQPVEVTLDAFPGDRFQARLEALDAALDSNGRSLLARARLQHGDDRLRAGLFARARVVFGVRDDALVVPEEALVPQGDKTYLIKVVDSTDGKSKVSRRIEARIGARIPGKVEILGGLAAGERVVTAGQPRLMRADGTPLKVVDVDRARPAARPASGSASAAGPAV